MNSVQEVFQSIDQSNLTLNDYKWMLAMLDTIVSSIASINTADAIALVVVAAKSTQDDRSWTPAERFRDGVRELGTEAMSTFALTLRFVKKAREAGVPEAQVSGEAGYMLTRTMEMLREDKAR